MPRIDKKMGKPSRPTRLKLSSVVDARRTFGCGFWYGSGDSVALVM
jgi:hypothetical protein